MKFSSYLSLLSLLTLGFVASTEPTEVLLEIFSQALLFELKNTDNEQVMKNSFINSFRIHRASEIKKGNSSKFGVSSNSLDEFEVFATNFIISLAPEIESTKEVISEVKNVSNFAEHFVLQFHADLEEVIDDLTKIKELCQRSIQAAQINLSDKEVDLSSSRIGNFTLKVIFGALNKSITYLNLSKNQITDISPLGFFFQT